MPAINRKFQGSVLRRFLASSNVRSGPAVPYFLRWFGVRPQDLSNFLSKSIRRKVRGRFVRVVVLEQRQGQHEVGKVLAARRVGDLLDVLDELRNVEEARHRRPFLGLFVDHHAGAHAAIRVAAAAHRAPLRFGAVGEVGECGEGADQRNREPVARRLDLAHLRADVLGQMRQRVALLQAALGSDFLVAAGERNGLEGHEGDFLGILHGELHDRAHLVVVQVVDDGRDQNDLDARRVHVFDGAQLHVEQVAHLAVAVGVVADAVELQVGVAQAGFKRLLAIILALGEFDAVGRRLHAVVAHLARVADGVEEIAGAWSARRRRTARTSAGAA